MDRNELMTKEKQLTAQLAETEKALKANQESQEVLRQLSKEGQMFLEDTMDLLNGSSDSHIFQALYDDQVSRDKGIQFSLERECEDLQHTYRHLVAQSEELSKELDQIKKEEEDGR